MLQRIMVLGFVALLATACSEDATGGDSTGGVSTAPGSAGGADLTGQCPTGSWTSTAMTAPSQAGIGDITATGGGQGIDLRFGADGVFFADFGPMQPATATFESGGQQGVLAVSFSGAGTGPWSVGADGVATASFDDFTTAKALATLTLGDTVPPIFDNTLQEINDQRMLDGQRVGVFTVTECSGDALTITTPFPGGTVEITAVRA